MTKSTRDKLTKQFKKNCTDRAKEIDGNDGQDWYSLTLGWALAKGLTPSDAHGFALHVRYDTDLG